MASLLFISVILNLLGAECGVLQHPFSSSSSVSFGSSRRGLFIPEELADLEQLLWRLAQGGGVMAPSPPVPQYRSPLGLDLHAVFITFCLEHGLQYLLYTYLEHYRCVKLESDH